MRGRVTEVSHTRILHLAHACIHVCVCCMYTGQTKRQGRQRTPLFRKNNRGSYDTRQRLENKLAMSFKTKCFYKIYILYINYIYLNAEMTGR